MGALCLTCRKIKQYFCYRAPMPIFFCALGVGWRRQPLLQDNRKLPLPIKQREFLLFVVVCLCMRLQFHNASEF